MTYLESQKENTEMTTTTHAHSVPGPRISTSTTRKIVASVIIAIAVIGTCIIYSVILVLILMVFVNALRKILMRYLRYLGIAWSLAKR